MYFFFSLHGSYYHVTKAGGAEVVTCNLCFSEQLVGLAVKVVIQYDRDLMEAILLYQVEFSLFSSDESRGGTLK